MKKHKVSTIDHRIGITLIPLILFLCIMLVVVYPGQSESSRKQFINTSQRTVAETKKGDGETKATKKSLYQKMIGNVKRLVAFPKQSRSEKKQTRKTGTSAQNHFAKTKQSEAEKIRYKGQSSISPNKNNIYDILISVVKRQKVIESMNKELIEKLSQKDDTITSLEYTEDVLWNQLEESGNKYWNIVTNKAYMEDALLAQLDVNKKKFQEALAARDTQYQKAVKRVSSSAEPVFGYSPPATEKRSFEPSCDSD